MAYKKIGAWMLRDNTHVYRRAVASLRRNPGAAPGTRIMSCIHCDSWVHLDRYQSPNFKRWRLNFCQRSQGMLFDRRFRLPRTKR